MDIRALQLRDAASLHAIHTACLNRNLSGRYTEPQLSAWMSGRTPEGYLRAAASGETFLVAEADGVVVGFAAWMEDELKALFIHPDWQRRGIGDQLARECLKRAASTGHPISRVIAVLGAETFYARFGFRVVGPGKWVKHGIEIPDVRMVRSPVPLRPE